MTTPTHYEMANAVGEAASQAVELQEDVTHGRKIVDRDQFTRIQRQAECLVAAHATLRALDRLQQMNNQSRRKAG